MLLVIAIIAILASIVIVAINPGRQLAQARNAQRASDIKSIYDAVNQYYIDNRTWPGGGELNDITKEICANGGPDGCLDLATYLVPTYLSAIPTDPQAENTGYTIALSYANRLALTAPYSTEYSLDLVAIGTTTAGSLGDVPVNYSCGDPDNLDCWFADNSTFKTWSNEFIPTSATSSSDGAANTAILVALDGSYPAAEYCNSLTEGDVPPGTWYLPAMDQLWAGWIAHGTEMSLYGAWSSSESNFQYARSLHSASGSEISYTKNNARRILCFH